MTKSLKDMLKVSGATLGSRILGLVRDSASMAYLGIGAVSSAYTIAFTLPNLMRRLLGEGALTSALVPIFTQSIKNKGQQGAFEFLNRLISRMFLLLLALTLAGIALSWGFGEIFGSELRFVLCSKYAIILMPYMLLICMAAIFSGALNVLGSFGAPSVGPAVLNVAIIGSLFAGVLIFGKDAEKIAYCMCSGWLVGGLFQLGIPAYYLRKKGWRFSPDLGKCPDLSELYALLVPALIGAAVIQLNMFMSKMIGMSLDDSAVPLLYLSGRLVEFPLGIFTITIATVYFPILSRLSSKRDAEGYEREYAKGLIMTICITVPAAFGLAALSSDILSLLFQYGIFNSSDVSLCVPVLVASVAGLPFFSLATFATKGFHSSKDTSTPVKISAVAFVLNIVLSLALMKPFGATGLASANALSAAVQSLLLIKAFGSNFNFSKIFSDCLKILGASILIAVLALLIRAAILTLCGEISSEKFSSALVCFVAIPVCSAAYFALLKIMNFSEFKDLSALKKKILGK